MKLAEALLIRADLQNKVYHLQTGLNNNATVQETETPNENPTELMQQLDQTFDTLEHLIAAINRTNSQTLKNGVSITEMLAKRDCMKERISVYRTFLVNASAVTQRARGSEIKIKSTVSVADLQKQIDRDSAQLRKLEIEIQELNWLTELL